MMRIALSLLVGFTAVVVAHGCSDSNDDADGSDSGDAGDGGLIDTNDSGAGGAGGAGSFVPACESFSNLMGCGAQAETAQTNIVNILLVVDKSGSMEDPFEGSGGSKWSAMAQALSTALDEVKESIAFGLELYPFRETSPIPLMCVGDECCTMPDNSEMNVPVREGVLSVPQIVNVVENTEPGGGTPTTVALQRALDYYTEGGGADLRGDKFVLLATDGGPNCNDGITCDAASCTLNIEERCQNPEANCCSGAPTACLDDDATVAQINALRAAGIDTFVVGIPGSEPYTDALDAFAEAGGRPNPDGPELHYRVDAQGGVAGLTEVFQSITRSLVRTCELQLEEVPANETLVNVAVDCEIIPKSPDGTGAGGAAGAPSGGEDNWILSGATNPPTVILQGELCDRIRNEGVERVDVVLGCPTVF